MAIVVLGPQQANAAGDLDVLLAGIETVESRGEHRAK